MLQPCCSGSSRRGRCGRGEPRPWLFLRRRRLRRRRKQKSSLPFLPLRFVFRLLPLRHRPSLATRVPFKGEGGAAVSSPPASLVVVAVVVAVVLVSLVESPAANRAALSSPASFLPPSRNTAWTHFRGIFSRVALFSLVIWTGFCLFDWMIFVCFVRRKEEGGKRENSKTRKKKGEQGSKLSPVPIDSVSKPADSNKRLRPPSEK